MVVTYATCQFGQLMWYFYSCACNTRFGGEGVRRAHQLQVLHRMTLGIKEYVLGHIRWETVEGTEIPGNSWCLKRGVLRNVWG